MHVYNKKYWKVKFRLRRWFGRTIYFLTMSQEKMNNQRISGKKFRFLNVWSFSYYRFPAFINYCFWCSSNATKSSKLSIIHVMQTSTVKTVCVYTKSSLWVSIWNIQFVMMQMGHNPYIVLNTQCKNKALALLLLWTCY